MDIAFRCFVEMLPNVPFFLLFKAVIFLPDFSDQVFDFQLVSVDCRSVMETVIEITTGHHNVVIEQMLKNIKLQKQDQIKSQNKKLLLKLSNALNQWKQLVNTGVYILNAPRPEFSEYLNVSDGTRPNGSYRSENLIVPKRWGLTVRDQ